MARFADQAEPEVRLKEPAFPVRCGTCAFRAGTIPNGCAGTLMDALKCVVERTPFYCHERKGEDGSEAFCIGWAMLALTDERKSAGETPWPFFGCEKESR
jgi:hypothetical protein